MSYDVIPEIIYSLPRNNEIPPPKKGGNSIPTILLVVTVKMVESAFEGTVKLLYLLIFIHNQNRLLK